MPDIRAVSSRLNAVITDLLLCELAETENKFQIMFYCPVYERDMRDALFTQMTSICDDIFWLDGYEEFELCLKKGTFFVADFICQAWKRRHNTLFESFYEMFEHCN